MIRRTFRKDHHLRKPAEFARVYALRCVVRQKSLTVFAAPNHLGHPRLGLSVSKKHGSAVTRNRLKRLLREAFRLKCHDWTTGLDLVLIPDVSQDATLVAFQAALARAVEKLAARLEHAPAVPGQTPRKPSPPCP